jgi:predicted transcriptional regulator
MSAKTTTLELDEATATALAERASARGISVPELVAEYVDEDRAAMEVDQHQIDELDRRWSAAQSNKPTVPNERVVRWLETWGTPAFKPWREE